MWGLRPVISAANPVEQAQQAWCTSLTTRNVGFYFQRVEGGDTGIKTLSEADSPPQVIVFIDGQSGRMQDLRQEMMQCLREKLSQPREELRPFTSEAKSLRNEIMDQ